MRVGWRARLIGRLLPGLAALASLLGAQALGVPPGPESRIRMTVEVGWELPSLPDLPGGGPVGAPPIELHMTDGRVIEAVAWPSASPGVRPECLPGGCAWSVGGATRGRVRARLEGSIGASLLVRQGAQTVVFPLAKLLEGPQQALPPSPIQVHVSRLSWDALEVDLAPTEGAKPGSDPGGTPIEGVAKPGEPVTVAVGLNVLAPEAAEAVVRLTATLRSVADGSVRWQYDQAHLVTTNASPPPRVMLLVPAPEDEGTYRLELQAAWEPAEREGSRIGRLIRRRRSGWPGVGAASRRVTLTVLAPKGTGPPAASDKPGTVVDTLDLAKGRGGHRLTATGRAAATDRGGWKAPPQALVDPSLRERLGGWLARGSEVATLAPVDPSGIAWSALGLKVAHPGRPHRLSITVQSGDPAALGVALIGTTGAEGRHRVELDAAAWGPPVAGSSEPARFSWLVWPGSSEPVLVLANHSREAPLRIGNVTVEELPGVPPPTRPIEPPAGLPRRVVALHVDGARGLAHFGGDAEDADPVRVATELAAYLAHCGASAAILPETFADRAARRALDGQADEDPIGPDRLGVTLWILGRHGLSALLELDAATPLEEFFDVAEGPPEGLPELPGGSEAPRHVLHPGARAAWERRVKQAIARRSSHPNLAGLLIRLGSGATLLDGPEAGLDDATYAAFVKAMFERSVPGSSGTDPGRMAARRQFVTTAGRTPWLTWRARQVGALYAGLARAVREAAPGAVLAVATPTVDRGPAGQEARRVEQAGLSPLDAWRAIGLDLDDWPSDEPGLLVLRGICPADEPLAQDLATHPELDAPVARRPRRGVFLQAPALPDRGSAGADALVLSAPGSVRDGVAEPLGHALAVLDAHWVVLSQPAIGGREEEVARFARVARSLPAAAEPRSVALQAESGVALRCWSGEGHSYLGLANDTPYTIVVEAMLQLPAEAPIDDLGRALRLAPEPIRGGKRVVIELAPFGVASLRAASPELQVPGATPYPREDLEAQFRALLARLERLAQGVGTTGPPNPAFEPEPPAAAGGSRPAVLQEIGGVIRTNGASPPVGWGAEGDPSNRVSIDTAAPHGGRGSLKLDARALPAAAVSGPFHPPGGSTLEVRAWLRSDQPGTRVRFWIEGESDRKKVSQTAELTVTTEWAERKIRVMNLPPGGLDQARLRFERLSPGTLWIDDLSLVGPHPSEFDRRAQRVLVTAVQAYRERRLADFARLAGSRWVDALPPAPAADAGAGGGAADASPLRTGAASDLPPARRLR